MKHIIGLIIGVGIVLFAAFIYTFTWKHFMPVLFPGMIESGKIVAEVSLWTMIKIMGLIMSVKIVGKALLAFCNKYLWAIKFY